MYYGDDGPKVVALTIDDGPDPVYAPQVLALLARYRVTATFSATGRRPAMFRAPYGAWSPAVLDRCHQLKLAPLDWSVDPRDWARPGVRSIVSTIMRTTRSGSIILEHDGGGDRSQTVAALGIALPRLLEAGYRFRTPTP